MLTAYGSWRALAAVTSTRVADALVERLASHGTRLAYMVAGGGIMFVNDALKIHPLIRVVPMHHEQSVAVATDYSNRCDARSAIAVVTLGPGGLNAITGVAAAWYDSVPMIIVSGQVKRSDRTDGSVRQLGVQEADVAGAVRPFVKEFLVVERPEDVIRIVDKAVGIASAGRCGPVWIEIPLDVQGAPFSSEGREPLPEPEALPTAIDGALVSEVVRLLGNAERPVLVGGQGVWRAGGQDSFRVLADALGAPVFLTWAGLDLLEADYPLLIGRPGIVASRGVNIALQNSDLVLAVGARLEKSLTAFDLSAFGGRTSVRIAVDIDAGELAKDADAIALAVNADARVFCESLAMALSDAAWGGRPEWVGWAFDLRDRFPMEAVEIGEGEAGRVPHLEAVTAVSDQAPEGAMIVPGSSGLAVEMFFAGFQVKSGQRVMHSGGLGAMGFGLPAAIGAACASGQTVVCVEGDGSLMMALQELAVVAAQNLPVKFFLFDNSGYASIRATQRNYFSGRFVGTGLESGLGFPDWRTIAEAFGIPFIEASGADDLLAAVEDAFGSEGPTLCRIPVSTDESLAPKVSAMPQADGSIVSMPMEDMAPLLPLEELEAIMLVPLAEASYRARGVEPPMRP